MTNTEESETSTYVAITNIPFSFHTADLRAHFSQFIESDAFNCFHFRHRPEKSQNEDDVNKRIGDHHDQNHGRRPVNVNGDKDSTSKSYTKCCCVANIKFSHCSSFLRKYHNQNWTDYSCEYYSDLCQVTVIDVCYPHSSSSSSVITSSHNITTENTSSNGVDKDVLVKMPELNPPELMPQGNVGTPTLVFMDLIQRCLLPHSLIQKLKLKFPKSSSKRLYSNVSLKYETQKYDCDDDTLSSQNSSRSQLIDASSVRFRYDKPLSSSKKHISSFADHQELSSSTVPNSLKLSREREETAVADSDHLNQTILSKRTSDESYESSSSKAAKTDDCLQNYPKSNLGTFTSTLDNSALQIVSGNESGNLFSHESSVNSQEISSREQHNLNTGSSFHSKQTNEESTVSCTVSHSTQPCLQTDQKQMNCSKSDRSDVFRVPITQLTKRERKRLKREDAKLTKKLMNEDIEERLIDVDKKYRSDDDSEEWDRHEASEDDPSNQERNKERLYEEEIEQPWEKGGPGVVFYTDAMFWQEREGDFDEQTTDDLDVDFSAYEEPGAGDKDIKDFLKIRQETRFRSGYDSTDRFSIGIGRKVDRSLSASCSTEKDSSSQNAKVSKLVDQGSKIGQFEKHTKGFGRKLMEKQGWKDGQGLGCSRPGIKDALKNEGQAAYNKKGLGYIQEKPVQYGVHLIKKRAPQKHLISTKYDRVTIEDPKEPLLLRSEPTMLKHRHTQSPYGEGVRHTESSTGWR